MATPKCAMLGSSKIKLDAEKLLNFMLQLPGGVRGMIVKSDVFRQFLGSY